MWKLIVGFVLFAGLAMFVLMRGGEIDMSGEKHGTETTHAAPAATPVSAVAASAPAAVVSSPEASAPALAASAAPVAAPAASATK